MSAMPLAKKGICPKLLKSTNPHTQNSIRERRCVRSTRETLIWIVPHVGSRFATSSATGGIPSGTRIERPWRQ